MWVIASDSKTDPYPDALNVSTHNSKQHLLVVTDYHQEYQLSQSVRRGERPVIPNTVPALWADLIQACWDEIPQSRPSFVHIHKTLLEINEAASE